jgi:hypothetical protein
VSSFPFGIVFAKNLSQEDNPPLSFYTEDLTSALSWDHTAPSWGRILSGGLCNHFQLLPAPGTWADDRLDHCVDSVVFPNGSAARNNTAPSSHSAEYTSGQAHIPKWDKSKDKSKKKNKR